MIPKVIHQMWCGSKPRPDGWMNTWQNMPGWGYRLWTEADIDSRTWGTAAFDYYRARDYWPGVKDTMMGVVLEEHGGVFVDADCRRLKDWADPPFMAAGGFAARTAPHKGQPGRLGVSIVGASPGSPVMRRWIDKIGALHSFEPEWNTVIPALAAAVAETDDDFLVLPQGTFYPVSSRGIRDDTVEPWAEHFWATTKGLYADPDNRGR